jgi:hypothetical protein
MIYNESKAPHFNFHLQPFAQQQMKPCPFCGHKPELANTHTPHYWMECTGCGCQISDPRSARGTGERSHRASALRAIEVWNRRMYNSSTVNG